MALDFPASPTNGQILLSGGISWTFDGEKWKVVTGATDTAFIVDAGNFANGSSLAGSSTDINGGSFD